VRREGCDEERKGDAHGVGFLCFMRCSGVGGMKEMAASIDADRKQ
jgi:hypothetical protein